MSDFYEPLHGAPTWETQVDEAYLRAASANGGQIPPVAGIVRDFNRILRADNATLMACLVEVVDAPAHGIPASLKPSMVAGLRQRQTTMPAGREVSDDIQNCVSRALVQASLHLNRVPGASENFHFVSNQYEMLLDRRREKARIHLENIEIYAVMPQGAVEWCERLVTKFTPQEIARADLADYAWRLERAGQRLFNADEIILNVLSATVALLERGEDVSFSDAEAVRQSVPHLAVSVNVSEGAYGGATHPSLAPRISRPSLRAAS